ncbi:histone deacetylase HDT1-like isoform X2 [Durio zibethinus]|uniref:Histone deacetylase HDT1-like isoform X2 n=1 Tax=Durio zibethinus TaxID=66656 RepID=A0A6P5ZSV4_DURZI|nr:histone deacetylase HDT1-like isoform X2 [Durio zibethinus]
MEFWGIEVKAGQPIKTDPGANYVIHLSQASLGETKNKAESVPLYVNANGKKLVLGTLSHQNFPQLSFDLVFDQDFELSHNWKNGSVYFLGYKTFVPEEGDDEFDMSSEEEELPMAAAENGKPKTDPKTAKANTGKPDAVKNAVKIAEPSNDKKTEEGDDDSDSEDESGSDEEDDSEDEDDSDEMSMDESSDDEDEETPKKVESSKKRPAEAAATLVSAKKAKSAATPQKTDGKKGGHTATPHPSKQAGKTSAKSPKSDGQFSCGSCNKSFGSDGGLESHKKAKHGGK